MRWLKRLGCWIWRHVWDWKTLTITPDRFDLVVACQKCGEVREAHSK